MIKIGRFSLLTNGPYAGVVKDSPQASVIGFCRIDNVPNCIAVYDHSPNPAGGIQTSGNCALSTPAC